MRAARDGSPAGQALRRPLERAQARADQAADEEAQDPARSRAQGRSHRALAANPIAAASRKSNMARALAEPFAAGYATAGMISLLLAVLARTGAAEDSLLRRMAEGD